jgi:predicted dehydrogenase
MARETGRILAICHVLRYSPFFQALRQVLMSGAIGRIVTVQHTENVAFWHMAHSFVRGPWSRKGVSSPMILSKSCHDLDILLYLINRPPLRVSSFGSLTWFRPENAPEGAADFCLDGCAAEPSCPYSVQKNYLGGNRIDWIKDSPHVSIDTSYAAKLAALRKGTFGRCVFKAGNDVVDHQVVNIEFEDGITVNFLLHAFAAENTRTMRYGCTQGEIRAHLDKNEIRVGHFRDGREEIILPGELSGGHSGGDGGMLRGFVEAVRAQDTSRILTGVETSLEGHLLAFAAEESRLNNGRMIDMVEYRARIEAETSTNR